MSESNLTSEDLIRGKLNSETARIAWHELQRFFAGGYTLFIAEELDLIDVAFQMEQDNASQIEQWMTAGQVRQVSNDQAREWFNDNRELWTCVVKPWVLVQPAD